MYTFVWFQLLSGCEFHLTADLSLERVILMSNFKFGLFRMNQTAADHGLSNVSGIWLPPFELVWCLELWLSDCDVLQKGNAETVTRRRSKEWTWYFSFLWYTKCLVKDGRREAELDSSCRGCKGYSHALHALIHLRMRRLSLFLWFPLPTGNLLRQNNTGRAAITTLKRATQPT